MMNITTTINKDIYDIIIETITKEWYESMNHMKDTKWEVPQYSGTQIENAGKTIAKQEKGDEYDKAIGILNNWRSSHAYPLHVITSELSHDNPEAIVVQRLKRLESIVFKLQRNKTMNLYRMQDLGGCRAIVDTIEDVYATVDRYKVSHTTHKLKKEFDYINNPKTSGYRSYHMVYQFQDTENDTYNRNMLIEIQVRTKLQHIWATAVEMMGIYTKTSLKSSIGDENVLRFFTLVSSVFALKENMPVCPGTSCDYDALIKEIKEINEQNNIVDKLSALKVGIKHTKEKLDGKGYYLLRLNYSKKTLTVHPFESNQIELATRSYGLIEYKNDPNMDTVLVSATSFEDLREAYPNYFTDINAFIEMMKEILK